MLCGHRRILTTRPKFFEVGVCISPSPLSICILFKILLFVPISVFGLRLGLLHDVYDKTRSSSQAIEVLCKALTESKNSKVDYLITSELAIPYYKYYSPTTSILQYKKELNLNYAAIQKCVDKSKVSAVVGIPSHTKNKLYNSAVLFSPKQKITVLRNKKNDFLKSIRSEVSVESTFESGTFTTKSITKFKNVSIAMCAEITRDDIIKDLNQNSKLTIVMAAWNDQKDLTRDYGPFLFLKYLIGNKKTIIWVNQYDSNKTLPVNYSFIASNGIVTYKSKIDSKKSYVIVVELDNLMNVKNTDEVFL